MGYDFSKWGAGPQTPFSMESLNVGANAAMGIDVANPTPLTNPVATDDWTAAFTKAGSGIPNIGASGVPGMATPGLGQQFNEWLKSTGIIGTKEDPGWGGMALGVGNGLASAYMGMQQYGLARDTLNQHKAEYAANYDAQKRTTNASMEDRQAGRIAAAGPNSRYQSVGDYMAKNGIK